MAILTGLGMALGAVSSAKQFFDGGKLKRESEAGLADFTEQELVNAYENVAPSMEAERLANINISKQLSTVSDVASGMDASTAMSMLSKGVEQSQQGMNEVVSSMMDKEFQADLMRAQDEVNIRNVVEKREQNRLASLMAQKNAGMQMETASIKDLGGLAISTGLSLDKIKASEGTDTNLFSSPGFKLKKEELEGPKLNPNPNYGFYKKN